MKYRKQILLNFHYKKVKDPVYKYELMYDVVVRTEIKGLSIETKYILLNSDGVLTIKDGYRWDGCSGPAIDTDTNARAGLVHDSLWQLIEEGHLVESYRHYSNRLLREICIEDGMWKIRAYAFYYSVDYVGRPYIKIKKKLYGR
jgi:hypothetical protein